MKLVDFNEKMNMCRYQDTFARKTNLQKNTYSSTHLVCPMPQGEKYKAAVKWKLPAVTAEWLVQCAAEMKLVDETEYLVGESTGNLEVQLNNKYKLQALLLNKQTKN